MQYVILDRIRNQKGKEVAPGKLAIFEWDLRVECQCIEVNVLIKKVVLCFPRRVSLEENTL